MNECEHEEAISNSVARQDLKAKVTSKQRLKERYVKIQKSHRGGGKRPCKGPEATACWVCRGDGNSTYPTGLF